MHDAPTSPAKRFVDREMFLDCVHCGLCLNACPTYVELGTEADSPRGRIYLMRQLEEGAVPLTDDVARHLDLCLGCRACESACPSGVRYGEMIEAARGYVEAHHRRGWRDRLRRTLLTAFFPRPGRLRVALAPLRVLEAIGLLRLVRQISALAGMLPPLRRSRPLPSLNLATAKERQRVGLLGGCVAGVLLAETNAATVRVLNRNGCSVVVPRRQACCGALYLHAGARPEALKCARRNIEVFGDDIGAILVNAAGCGAMMKEYGELLADDPVYAERARAFSARVKDLTEFLVDLPFEAPTTRLNARVTYHDACHLAHGQGIREQPRALLRQIPGVSLVELPDSEMCCGSAGSYNITEPEMARRLGERKVEAIRATGAMIVAAANPGCAMQIRSSLRRMHVIAEVVHPVELLDRAYGS
jgi:glycolate oxidase iron-sulfur subunit